MFSLTFIRDNFTFILSALPVTLAITLLSLLFSTLLGAALAWAIIRQIPGVQVAAKVFLSFGRSVPVLVMLYFFFTSGRGWPSGCLAARRTLCSAINSRRWRRRSLRYR
jgi:ABC-type amino acid transport system permease subunit